MLEALSKCKEVHLVVLTRITQVESIFEGVSSEVVVCLSELVAVRLLLVDYFEQIVDPYS